MLETLKKYFWYNAFRPQQEQIVQSILNKKDTFVLMPTGWGKSLCYQLPAIMAEWVTLVISPLIALMKDQVDSLQGNGIGAACYNSSMSNKEKQNVIEDLRDWTIKLLYISPERLSAWWFADMLHSLPISLIAIDEAHCLSERWHDFRPDYNNLWILRRWFPTVPIIALTATATQKVQDDIVKKLKLYNPQRFVWSFDRPNLSLHVVPKRNSFDWILDLLKKHTGESAIIYCFSRKETESLAEKLHKAKIRALPYHAWLSDAVRVKNQEEFIRDQVDVIVATVAFGMGIDKPDVRLVIHYVFPKTVEWYYQEIGRAGRDGLPSECVLFYSHGDKRKHDFFIDQLDDRDEQEKARNTLQKMVDYCEWVDCRRTYLLNYFDETSSLCNNCDQCLDQSDTFDATIITQKILSAVIRTGQRYGSGYVIDVLQWSRKKIVLERQHDTLSVHGIVNDYSVDQLRHIMRQLLAKNLLIKEGEKYPIFSVHPQWVARLQSKDTIHLVKPKEEKIVAKKKKWKIEYDQKLFEQLRWVRKRLAGEKWVPPFMIFSDVALHEMAYYYPVTTDAFMEITGVGEKKIESYGEDFLTIIEAYVEKNGLSSKGL